MLSTTESGKTTLLDIQSLMSEAKKAGYKVLEFKDIPASHGTFNPFAGMYDILGEERKSFLEKLSEITEFHIIEEEKIFVLLQEYHTCRQMD